MSRKYSTRKRKSLRERFEAKVGKPDKNGCWPWTGAIIKKLGYGEINSCTGITLYARRVAWELTNGEIPDGLYVLHRCDNKWCVNPAHLFLGTAGDNARDMVKKNRHMAAVCPEKIARGDRSGARTHPERVARGDRHWTHLYPDKVPRGDQSGSRLHPESRARGDKNGSRKYPERLKRGEEHYSAKLTAAKVLEIRKKYKRTGPRSDNSRELGEEYGVTYQAICRIVKRLCWRHI
jgi:hypothetical protein